MTIDLLPCPFCGGEALGTLHGLEASWSVACFQCDAAMPYVGCTEAEAAAAWNRRSPAPAPSTDRCMTIDLEALKDALAKATPGPLTFVDRGEARSPGSPTYEVLEIEFDDTDYYPRAPQKKDAKAMVMAFNSAPAMIATIQAQAERIAALEEALRPLAEACEKADRSAADRLHLGMGIMSDTASPGWGVKYGHLKAARAALGDKS